MSSQLPQLGSDENPLALRRAWSRPDFTRLETGEAEASDGVGPDTGQMVS